MSAKPTDSARWGETSGGSVTSNLTLPSSGHQDTGWVLTEAPTSGFFNWLAQRAYKWFQWLDDGDCTFHNLGATGTLSVTGNTTVGGTFTVSSSSTSAVAVGNQLLSFADFTFTADHTTSLFARTAHGLQTGDGPVRLTNSGGALPGVLVTATDYWVIRIDANTYQIAASRDCALEGVQIDFLDNGTGTQTLQHQVTTTRVTDTTLSRALAVGGMTTLHDTVVGGELFTFPSTVFIANSTFDVLAIDNHPFRTGDGPLRVTNSGGALPSPLLVATDYWAIRTNSGKFQLATNRGAALVGMAIDLATAGTGTNTIASGTGASHVNSLIVHGTIDADDFVHGLDTDVRAPADGTTSSIGTHPCSFLGTGWALNTSAEGILFTFPRLRAGDHIRSWTVWFTKASSGSETLSAVFEHWDDGSASQTPILVSPGTAFGPSVSIGGGAVLQTSANNPGFTSMGVTGLDVIVQTGQQFEISIVNIFSSSGGTATGDIIVSAKVTFDRPRLT